MKTLNFKRIISIVAFVALAGFSCFWTAESLFIWQPSITIVGAWLIAVVFYILASICFSRFIKGFERFGDFGQGLFASRGGHLFFGLVGLLIFWLMVSLPTNTHTLLYRASIKEIIKSDLTRTQGYLQGLKDNNVEVKKIEDRYKSKKDAVDAIILRMVAEIDNPSAIGIGHRFETILVELDRTLFEGDKGNKKIQRVANVGTTRSQWLTAINYYQSQAYEQLKLYRAKCDKEIEEVKQMMGSKTLGGLIKNCEIALSDVNKMDGVNNDIIKAASDDLANGYSFIKANSQYIVFKDNDKERYTRDGAMPEAKEMLSVPDVWKDYLTTDKYSGHGFIWWVFIALLVDLAGFVFFNFAFAKDNNNVL